MNNDRILLSETLDRIGDAVNDIRTVVDMENNPIEEVADAVEALADNDYNAYKVATMTEMGNIDSAKLNLGDVCTVAEEGYASYIPYYNTALTRVLIFPESFTTSEEIEEFSDVNFSVYTNTGSVLTAGGNVSLTKGGGCGCGSGSGGSALHLGFDLVFNSEDPSRPCDPFTIYVGYDFDEDEDKWIRTQFGHWETGDAVIIGNAVILPIECGFNKTGGGNLPSIISDCVKLYAHQEDPNPAGTSETLARAFIYDGFFLPSEIPVSMLPLNNPVLYSVDGTTNISFSYTGQPSGIKAFTGSANSGRWDINIQYINSNANWILKTISIQDKRTDTYIYNYDNCNTVYPGYDFYVYFPIEYYLRGHLGYGKAFQQIVTQKPRTYEYKINGQPLPDESTELWIRQL